MNDEQNQKEVGARIFIAFLILIAFFAIRVIEDYHLLR